MQFNIRQTNLKTALAAVSGCVDKKPSVPVLAHILIESIGENNIRLTATNQDLTIRYDCPAEIIKPGSLCINGEKLIGFASVLPDADVSFDREDTFWTKVQSGKSKIRLAGINPETFPATPAAKSTPIQLDGDDFRLMIRQTIFVTSEELSQYALNGIKCEIGNGTVRMATANNARLGIATLPTSSDGTLDLIIPRKAANEIAKMEGADLSIGDDDNHLFLQGDGVLLIARKLNGKFPAYQMMIPKENPLTASFDVEEMRDSIRRCGMLASLDTVRCEISSDGAVLRSNTSEAGEIEESVEMLYEGEPVTIGIRWQHFLDFLNIAESGRADINFSDNALVPALVTADTLEGYQYILVLLNLVAQENQKTLKAA